MRAKFILETLNEKFKETTDPIKDMNIGYPESQVNRMSWKILNFIADKGKEGAKLGEIQYYIWTELEGHSPESFWKKSQSGYRKNRHGKLQPVMGRKTRGHWNTRLLGNTSWGERWPKGILLSYCKKNPVTKRWTIVRMPKPNEKFFKTNES